MDSERTLPLSARSNTLGVGNDRISSLQLNLQNGAKLSAEDHAAVMGILENTVSALQNFCCVPIKTYLITQHERDVRECVGEH